MITRRKITTLIAAASIVSAAPTLVAPAQASAAPPRQPAVVAGAPALPMIDGGRRAVETRGAMALWAGGRFTCTASYLGNSWAITAKHCLGEPRSNWRLQAGSLRRGGGRTLNVSATAIIRDPDNDIALMRVTGNTDGLATTPLSSGENVPEGELVSVRGWGRKGDGRLPKRLREADKVFDEVGASNRLFFMSRGDGDTTAGDSGGPVIWNGQHVGVLSRSGADTDMAPDFSSATNLADGGIRAWIRQNTGV